MKKHFNYFLEGWGMISMLCFPVLLMTIPSPKNILVLLGAAVLGYLIGTAMAYVIKNNEDGRDNI